VTRYRSAYDRDVDSSGVRNSWMVFAYCSRAVDLVGVSYFWIIISSVEGRQEPRPTTVPYAAGYSRKKS
jgi:hypothetical protein